MSTPTTTITTAQFRAWSPWEYAGKLANETIWRTTHSNTPDTVLISSEEHAFHASEVADQDAKIEAFKREVMGVTEEGTE